MYANLRQLHGVARRIQFNRLYTTTIVIVDNTLTKSTMVTIMFFVINLLQNNLYLYFIGKKRFI